MHNYSFICLYFHIYFLILFRFILFYGAPLTHKSVATEVGHFCYLESNQTCYSSIAVQNKSLEIFSATFEVEKKLCWVGIKRGLSPKITD